MATLEELFAGRNLTAMVQGIKPGLPLAIPPEFMSPTDRVPGHTFEWLEVDGNRDMATIVSQDSPAKRVGLRGYRRKSATMLRSFEAQTFTLNKLRNLLTQDGRGVRDEMGRAFVTEQTTEFKRRLSNLVQNTAQVMFFTWELHFNEKGELLTSSSGATTSITVSVPAGQKNQLDILGGGAIIGASWATATTDIPGQLESIRQQMLELGGWMITEAYYGKNIAKYIAANDYAKTLIQQTPSLATQVFANANRVPTGFMEFNWRYAGHLYYVDAGGTVRRPVGDDEIIFTPAPSDRSWWKLAVGSEMVPSGVIPVGADASAMLSNVQEVFGEFSYATLSTNPLSIEQFVGHNFLPLVTATKAVCRADVTP